MSTLEHPRTAGLCVFVAEDDPAFRSLLVDLLKADGHEVMAASDGGTLLFNLVVKELQAPGTNRQALVICDVRMPGCDGLAVLRNMNEDGPGHPEFVFMTAFPSPEIYEEARQLGALGVLAKPFDLDELRALVRGRLASGGA